MLKTSKFRLTDNRIDHTFVPPVGLEGSGDCELDMESIEYVSSTGIKLWIDWTSKLKGCRLFLSNCKPVLVNQLNSISMMIPKGSVILSFYVPFYSATLDKETIVLFESGKDFANGKITRSLSYNSEDATDWVIDVFPEKYFRLVSLYSHDNK
jgi:hypothetical protein